MKTKITVLGLMVMAVLAVSYTRIKHAAPSDLRDAVSDNGAIGELTSLGEVAALNVPAPDKAKASARKKSGAGKNKAARLEGNWLKQSQQTALLAEIDSVCGDTWCEGQFNYRFTSFECEKGLCSLELFMWDYYGEPQSIYSGASGSAGRLPAERVTCDMKGFQKYGDLMESTAHGRPALSEKLYVDISDCIAKAEASSGVPLVDR